MGKVGIFISLIVIVVLAATVAGGYYFFSIRPQQTEFIPLPSPAPALTQEVDRVGFSTLPTPVPGLTVQGRIRGVTHDFRSNPELVLWGDLVQLTENSLNIKNPDGPTYEFSWTAADPVRFGQYSPADGRQLPLDKSEFKPGDRVSIYFRVNPAEDIFEDIALNKII